MTTYLDVEKKLNYHKEQLLKELIKKGIYPTNSLIANRINSINKYLALFKYYEVVPGNNFDTKEYNECLKLIYEDLKILYDILYKLTVEEFHKQQNFINTYINELQSTVDMYNKRADFENNSTTFGKTLLFKNNSFTIESNNSTTIINLEDIELEEGSKIACMANINNVNEDNLIFSFVKDGGKESIDVTPYNYSNETLTVPGTKTINAFDFNISEDQKTSGPIIMNIDTEIDAKNKYTILGGKNKMFINYPDSNKYSVEDIPTSLGSFMFTERSYINFYVVGGNSVTFKFNKKPIATNFPIEEQRITNLNTIHHFFIECDNDFCFEIELDKGNLYGVNEDGIINNNKLFYTGTSLIKDFHIIEQSAGKMANYKGYLKIFNNNNDDVDIDSIIIKKMS